jgi:hypothetical protein
MTAPGAKACCKCGAPVADSALGRGALEDPDGRRYCSPCAGALIKSDHPEAQALKAISARTAKPSTVIANVQGALTRRAPSTRSAQVGKTPGVPSAPVAKVPSVPAARIPAAPASKAKIAPRPAAAKPPAAAAAAAPAAPPTAITIKPAKSSRKTPLAAPSSSSRRMSARSKAAWYQRMSRAQLIGALCGAGAVLLFGIIVVASSCSSGNRKKPQVVTATPIFGSGAQGMIAEADYLYGQGKRDACLAKLEEAQKAAGVAAEKAREEAKKFRAAGLATQAAELENQAKTQDALATEAGRKKYGIFKTTTVNAR